MAQTLLGAITAYFDQSSAAAIVSTSGGLWIDEIPEKPTFPLVALMHNGETPEYEFEEYYLENGSVQFEVFAVGCQAAEALALRVKAAFDPLVDTTQAIAALSIDNARPVYMKRVGYKVSSVGSRDLNGNQVFQCSIPYETVVRKTIGTS